MNIRYPIYEGVYRILTLVIAGLFGFPDPYDLGANALERVA